MTGRASHWELLLFYRSSSFFSIFAASLQLTDAVNIVSRGTTQEDGDLGNLVVGVCRGERRREKWREIPVGEA